MADLDSIQTPPYMYFLLMLGVISFSAAVVSTCTGKAWSRYDDWVYRAERPIQFWSVVAAYYFVGVFFVGIFGPNVYGFLRVN